jgi:peptidoglycan/xylan/chitin deacetylase (PgdA/CDA1 family)
MFQMISQSLRSAARRVVKRLVIQAGLEATAWPGAGRLLPSAAGRGVIFTLHHVRPARDNEFEPNAHLSITPEFLEQAIVAARQCGLIPVHLEDLPGLLADSTDTRKFMCFTLDDGYRDNEKFAAPVFRKHRVPYTIFIAPGFVERTRTIWWETAEELTRAASSFEFDFGRGVESLKSSSRFEKFVAFERLVNFVQSTDEDEAIGRIDLAAKLVGVDPESIVDLEIMTAAELQKLVADPLARLGAHTITHPNLARVVEKRLRQELKDSAVRVADYCGYKPKVFAYPYGGRHAVGSREARAVMEAGFTLAVTTQPGVLSARSLEARAELPRVSLNGGYQKSRYVRALVSGLPFRWIP